MFCLGSASGLSTEVSRREMLSLRLVTTLNLRWKSSCAPVFLLEEDFEDFSSVGEGLALCTSKAARGSSRIDAFADECNASYKNSSTGRLSIRSTGCVILS